MVAKWGQVYAEALKLICQHAFPRAEVEACSSGKATLATLRARPADLVLLTLTFSDYDGIDLLQAVIEENLSAKVLLGCRRRDEHCLHSLRNARFDGILDTLHENLDTMLEALETVACGRAYVSPAFRDIVVDRIVPSSLWQKLTAAEIKVLKIIGDGSDDQEAAAVLALSAATVQTHRRNIMRKLGVTSSAKLVRESIRLGIVRITDHGRIIRPGFTGQLGREADAHHPGKPGCASRFLPTGSQ
ncbi:MAG: response regulator transcription factor [Opitutaceae bacterium]|nr:response regulator transcription factor [Opitutaceae bacterium]